MQCSVVERSVVEGSDGVVVVVVLLLCGVVYWRIV